MWNQLAQNPISPGFTPNSPIRPDDSECTDELRIDEDPQETDQVSFIQQYAIQAPRLPDPDGISVYASSDVPSVPSRLVLIKNKQEQEVIFANEEQVLSPEQVMTPAHQSIPQEEMTDTMRRIEDYARQLNVELDLTHMLTNTPQ